LSRLFLCENYSQPRKEPLATSETTHCAIHLNAYYLNLSGSLDNLAWVLQYEWQLLPGVSEDGGRERQACQLFRHRFLNQSTEDWYTHAATFVCSSAAIFSTAAVTAGS
jgi:hypothetical protein